jgi:non-homologous end joining protein Ku
LIEAKLQGRPADEAAPPAILPLLEALRRSVAAHEPTESAPPTPTVKKRSPRKRTPTRRTA